MEARALHLQTSQGLLLAMSRFYIGNLDARVSEQELQNEFRTYEVIRRIWVAIKPPGYAFIDFDDRRDTQDAIRDLDGKYYWSVELSHYSIDDGDCSGRDRGFEELGSGNRRHCSQTHLSDCQSPDEHPYLSTTLTQTSTPISYLTSFMSHT